MYFFCRHVHKHCHTHCQIKSLVGLLLGRCQPSVSMFSCERGITAFLPLLLLLLSYMDLCQWTSSPVSRPYLTSRFLFSSASHPLASPCLLSHTARTHIQVHPGLTYISCNFGQEVCAAKLLKMTCAEYRAGK